MFSGKILLSIFLLGSNYVLSVVIMAVSLVVCMDCVIEFEADSIHNPTLHASRRFTVTKPVPLMCPVLRETKMLFPLS